MRRKAHVLGAIAVAGALALAGCAGGGNNGGSASVPLSDINSHDRGDLEDGGTLRMTITAMPTNYNTLNVQGNNVDTSTTIGRFVLPTSWLCADDGSYEANPTYIESFESDVDNDKQVVTLNLNQKAVWGDGTPITVADYVATWESCNGQDEEKLCASTDGFDHMESVEQGDSEYQVIVTFNNVYPDWSAPLSTVYPASGITDVATFNEGWITPNNDWFAGPYQFASIDDAQQVVSLERNPNWWGETPLLDSVTFRVMDPAGMGNAFANGEIDVLDGIIDAQQYLQAETRADAVIHRSTGLTWRHFTFNTESGVLADKAVRQALVRGIDRVAITEADLAGIPDMVPADLVKHNHFFQPGQVGYEVNDKEFGFDREQAGKELDELGWTLAEGAEYRTKDGETLEFAYTMMPDISTSKTEGELLQSQMKELGVKVDIQNVSPAEFFDEYVIPGNFASVAFGWQGTQYPLNNILQIYGCESFGGSNFQRSCIQELDELAGKVATEGDSKERNKLGNEADRMIWDDAAVVPLYNRMEITATSKGLANFGAFGLSSVAPENIGFVKGELPGEGGDTQS